MALNKSECAKFLSCLRRKSLLTDLISSYDDDDGDFHYINSMEVFDRHGIVAKKRNEKNFLFEGIKYIFKQ